MECGLNVEVDADCPRKLEGEPEPRRPHLADRRARCVVPETAGGPAWTPRRRAAPVLWEGIHLTGSCPAGDGWCQDLDFGLAD